MAGYADCIRRIAVAAGRALTDAEIGKIYERVHQAALDVKAGRVDPADVSLGQKLGQDLGIGKSQDTIVQQAAQLAAARLEREAAKVEQQTYLQLVKLGARTADYDAQVASGLAPLDAVQYQIERSGSFSGRSKVASLEQMQAGYQAEFRRRLIDTWESLGSDYMGFFQDKTKLVALIKELRGEDSGVPLAKKGAEAFHKVAEEARKVFNANGGDVGRLDDWGMPQHHSQERVAMAGKDAWVNAILPMLDRSRYVDSFGAPRSEAEIRAFLGKAWDTIATNGIANLEPGKSMGSGKKANQHAESRQIHFKDADSVVAYWDQFGERTAVEILLGHVDTMARDIAFIEHFGPNPNVTYQTLRDQALLDIAKGMIATGGDAKGVVPKAEAEAVKLDTLYDYAVGRMKPTYSRNLRATADGIANLNVAGKLGGSMIASLFGDKPMMEAVSHMNDLPMIQRWRTELSLFNPANATDRRLLERQGLMLDSVRSGLQRFYEGLGQSGTTGRIANAVMRITGMQAVNDIRKGAFGLSLMSAIGNELQGGRQWNELPRSDVRTLRNYGISKVEWNIWKLATLDTTAGVSHVLTPESIGRITDAQLKAANIIGQADGVPAADAARRSAVVKLLGAINTESEFAIVTPGWKERAAFYGDLQRGTVKGEIFRSMLQFKAFPWAFLQRSMDAYANMDGPVSKAGMTAWLIGTTTLAGAMIMQTREVLAGKDPLSMMDKNWYKFWGKAFLQGGALGIFGDFLYGANQTRQGSGILETVSGPTLGPLLELGLVQPMNAAAKRLEGKDTHLGAQTISDLKGFVPGNNIWYLKAATEHLVWQRVMEALSPGYLATIRAKTAKDANQEWWWKPGETTPERGPDMERVLAR